MNSKKWIMVSIVLIVFAILGSLAYIQFSKDESNKVKTPETLEESYQSVSTMGEKTAKVHIVEFGDYKCPYCKKFHEDFVPFVAKEYVATGKVQFHFINFAFIGTDSKYMAEFAESVRQELGEGSYWKFHDLVYANQQNERDIWGTEENMTMLLESFASKEEVEKVLKAVKEGKYEQHIEDQDKLVKKLGVSGTPAIFIDGKQVKFKSYEELHQMIEDAVNGKK